MSVRGGGEGLSVSVRGGGRGDLRGGGVGDISTSCYKHLTCDVHFCDDRYFLCVDRYFCVLTVTFVR